MNLIHPCSTTTALIPAYQNNKTERHAALYKELLKKTEEHILYLSSIGLTERAKSIKVVPFVPEKDAAEHVDLSTFAKRSPIPTEVLHFNPHAKNTLITTDPDYDGNNPQDLQRILDIRLHPALKNLIEQNRVEVFVGTKQELTTYYSSKGSQVLLKFTIPSAATYYLAESDQQELFVILAGLASRENIIAQLLTLKLAGIQTDAIEIIGEIEHFNRVAKKDISLLLDQIPELKTGKHVLIVAGCGESTRAGDIINRVMQNSVAETKSFSADIVSLKYVPLTCAVNGINGFICLDLTYGEITEEIVSLLLQYCSCSHVFTGGAGGYIAGNPNAPNPEIGTRVRVSTCMNEQGETVTLDDSCHLQVSSIFLETFEWLEKAHKRGTSVDVETFYIIRAIQRYNAQNPSSKIEGNCGYFVSDYVGEKPLRDYSRVYQKYDQELRGFIEQTLSIAYAPKPQSSAEIIIKSEANDPRLVQIPRMNTTFMSQYFSHDLHLQQLNPRLTTNELFTHKNWDIAYYDRENYPVVLGKLDDPSTFSLKKNGVGLRFLDMPIFMPTQGWRIPFELEQFKEVIAKAVAFERRVNPDFEKKCYVYITVDQGEVEPHKAQRRTGWHGDSYLRIDSRKKKIQLPCDHVYVIADNCPTPFLPGPFSLKNVDAENVDAVLAHFAAIAEGKTPTYYPNYTLLKLDPYCVHNVGFNNTEQPLFRTFVKISISQSKYCKLGNAHNPLFIYDWPMVLRHNVPYDNTALQNSSHRKDRDRFIEINPHTVDFSQDTCFVDWAEPAIDSAVRIKEMNAEPAVESEIIKTLHDGFLTTIYAAGKGDWKVTVSHAEHYFLSAKQLERFYSEDPVQKGRFLPKPI